MKPNDLPLISVVIPNYNGVAYLAPCLLSLARQSRSDFEVLVVDNDSSDASVETVRRLAPRAVVLRQDRNLGFAGAANAGVRAAAAEWIAVLNNDTEVSTEWVEKCAEGISRHPDAVFLACRILEFGRRDRVYSVGDCFLRAGIGYRRGQEQRDRPEYDAEGEVFSACGCAALYRKSALEFVGGYDDRLFAYMEDVELGLRLQAAGLRGFYLPAARVYHHGAATGGGEFSPLSVALRTRNSLLLLLKSVPAEILVRCVPMVLASQVFWLGRVIRHGRVFSFLRGLAGALRLAPAMLRSRSELRRQWSSSVIERLWTAIVRSEAVARVDCGSSASDCPSFFLRFYFRLFRPVAAEGSSSARGRR